jgi:protocatechuate 3,4-dioxygenase beta subunit
MQSRRFVMRRAGLLAAALALPALAQPRRVMPAMTEGPFYPPRRWRDGGPLAGDWDFDLTTVQRGDRSLRARGEYLGLRLQVDDAQGRRIDGAEVEIWQCDALAAYRHPNVPLEPGRHDEGFQGFGSATTGRDAQVSLRTIRPVPYPGRTPHIHVTLRHASFGELTSQLFVAGDAGNAGDFLWRRLREADQQALAMRLLPGPPGSGLRWVAEHTLVVPA